MEFIDHEALPKRYREMEKTDRSPVLIARDQSNSLICNRLKLDLDQSVIQYQDNPPIEISTGINIFKMLALLMRNKRVVEYTEVARELQLNCYNEGVRNQDVAREVQFLRRDLGTFLLRTGMNKSEIRDMFISKKNVGYKLRFDN